MLVDGESDADREEFQRSTPELTPNLSDQYATDEEKARSHIMYGDDRDPTKAEIARDTYGDHKSKSYDLRDTRSGVESAEKEINSIQAAIRQLSWAETPDMTEDEIQALQTSKELLRKRKESIKNGTLWDRQGEALSAEDRNDARIHRAEEFLRNNREAFENEAVNDYHKAQAGNPDQFPDPLTYGDNFPQNTNSDTEQPTS